MFSVSGSIFSISDFPKVIQTKNSAHQSKIKLQLYQKIGFWKFCLSARNSDVPTRGFNYSWTSSGKDAKLCKWNVSPPGRTHSSNTYTEQLLWALFMIVLTNIDKASTMFKALSRLLGIPVNQTGLSPTVWWMRDRQIMISDMENARQRGRRWEPGLRGSDLLKRVVLEGFPEERCTWVKWRWNSKLWADLGGGNQLECAHH